MSIPCEIQIWASSQQV